MDGELVLVRVVVYEGDDGFVVVAQRDAEGTHIGLPVDKGVTDEGIVYDDFLQGTVGQCVVAGHIGLDLSDDAEGIQVADGLSVLVHQLELGKRQGVGWTFLYLTGRDAEEGQQDAYDNR